MDTKTLQKGMIDSEIRAACQAHGADFETLAPTLREQLFVTEQNGKATVAVRLNGSDTPQLSTRAPSSDTTTLANAEELLEELRDSGKHAAAFPAPRQEPTRTQSHTGERTYRHPQGGEFTRDEIRKMGPSERIAMGRANMAEADRPKPRNHPDRLAPQTPKTPVKATGGAPSSDRLAMSASERLRRGRENRTR